VTSSSIANPASYTRRDKTLHPVRLSSTRQLC